MLRSLNLPGSRQIPLFLQLIVTALIISFSTSLKAQTEQMPHEDSPLPTVAPEPSPDMSQTLTTQVDPLDSPYPVPWHWVLTTNEELSQSGTSGLRYYRSPSLVSPDGRYAAYSRLKMQSEPNLFLSRVTSVMFMENLETGDLKTITASSPLASHPFEVKEEAELPGTIAILIPVSWSRDGDRILSRQFEGIFSTSAASDYAVIWDRDRNSTHTLAPNQVSYTNAVLLGWSQSNPDQVLFRAGTLGDEHWPVWAVNIEGQTFIAEEDKPTVYGQVVKQVWSGPQGL